LYCKYYRNKTNNLAKRLKSTSIKNKLNSNSPKQFWSNLKSILPSKYESSSKLPSNTDYKPTDNDFAKFFSGIATEILNNNTVPHLVFKPLNDSNDFFKFILPKFSFKTIFSYFIYLFQVH
jgi:hypothetical protein